MPGIKRASIISRASFSMSKSNRSFGCQSPQQSYQPSSVWIYFTFGRVFFIKARFSRTSELLTRYP